MKFVCILICLLLTFFLPVANAEGQWVRVTEEGVSLYATCESSKVIFLLEKSYYLQVLSEQNGMYQVAVMPNTADFPQITGYVWIGEVDDCEGGAVAVHDSADSERDKQRRKRRLQIRRAAYAGAGRSRQRGAAREDSL